MAPSTPNAPALVAPGAALDAAVGDGGGLPPFSYAFQPIVDVAARSVFAYEALVRGPAGEPARSVFAQVPPGALHRFDRTSRLAAVALAGRLGLTCHLTLNALPRGLRGAEADLRALLDTAERCGLPRDRLVLEVTEGEVIDDRADFGAVIDDYRAAGVLIAIDDFGAGFSGLNLLADVLPDVLKLDMHLVRGIESRGPRQSIVRAIGAVCADLGIDVIAEGVETREEYAWFAGEGVRLFQGYLFAKPAFERLPPASFG